VGSSNKKINSTFAALIETEEEIIEFPEIENFFSYKEIEEIILKNPYRIKKKQIKISKT
jgi:hypothetical protein